jgi:mannitol-1-phosphate/altronate dehydrogenase
MANKDVQSDLVVEVMKLLQKFQPGGESGPIEDRDEWEQRVQSHAPQERELLQELTRFADLWRYFQENKETFGPEILAALTEVPQLAVPERIERMREIIQKLMERIPDAGEGPEFRN